MWPPCVPGISASVSGVQCCTRQVRPLSPWRRRSGAGRSDTPRAERRKREQGEAAGKLGGETGAQAGSSWEATPTGARRGEGPRADLSVLH